MEKILPALGIIIAAIAVLVSIAKRNQQQQRQRVQWLSQVGQRDAWQPEDDVIDATPPEAYRVPQMDAETLFTNKQMKNAQRLADHASHDDGNPIAALRSGDRCRIRQAFVLKEVLGPSRAQAPWRPTAQRMGD